MSIRPQGKRSGRENQKTESERQQIEEVSHLLDVAGLRMEEGATDHGTTSCQQPKQAGNGAPQSLQRAVQLAGISQLAL